MSVDKKSFFSLNEIWYVGRGQRVMHDTMPYYPIQRHRCPKFAKMTEFKVDLLPWYACNQKTNGKL